MKEVKKITGKKNLYLTIYDLLKQGLRPSEICEELNIKKQNLQYYLTTLKCGGYIEKIGYGVWEITEKEVQKEVQKMTKDGITYSPKIKDLTLTIDLDEPISYIQLKKVLKSKKLDKCIFCDYKIFELHHVLEKHKGGIESLKNLIPTCPNHHQEIHNEGLSELKSKQLKKYYQILGDPVILTTDMVRGHAFMFTLKLPSKLRNWDRREEILEKMGIDFKPLAIGGINRGQKINFKGRKIWLTDRSIVIYERSSYLADTAEEAKDHAVADLITLVKALEKKLHANLSFGGQYKFKVSRQHYALIKNALARQYDREGKKLQIYNSSGLWFLIDNSYNLHEAETVHSKTAVSDNEKVQNFFNGVKEMDGFTPSFVVTSLGKAVEQIGYNAKNMNNYAVHLKAHVQSVKDLGSGVGEQNKIFKKILKVLERLEK